MPTSLNINGTRQEVDLPADVPLPLVLRDELGLTCRKLGCRGAAFRAFTRTLRPQLQFWNPMTAWAALMSPERPPSSPARGNSLFDLTGKRARALPFIKTFYLLA